MTRIKVSRFDAAEHLDSDEVVAAYLNAALEENDVDLLMIAINNVAKARGIAAVAKAAGLGRESLYKTLTPGSKPRMETVLKLLRALNLRLVTQPGHATAS